MRPNSQGGALFSELATFGGRIVTPGDAEYPAGLLGLDDPPERLYVRGRVPLGGIAVVGTRTPTIEAILFAYDLSRNVGEPVVSGLARGIDTAAHRGAFAGGVPTAAYVAHGFGSTYPPENANIETRIAAGCGAVLSEREPGAFVTASALVRRDRLQAAHAWAVVLVQSEPGGGAMHAVRYARALGRPCFVLEPLARDAGWGGNRLALEGGATALPADVERALRIIDAQRSSAARF